MDNLNIASLLTPNIQEILIYSLILLACTFVALIWGILRIGKENDITSPERHDEKLNTFLLNAFSANENFDPKSSLLKTIDYLSDYYNAPCIHIYRTSNKNGAISFSQTSLSINKAEFDIEELRRVGTSTNSYHNIVDIEAQSVSLNTPFALQIENSQNTAIPMGQQPLTWLIVIPLKLNRQTTILVEIFSNDIEKTTRVDTQFLTLVGAHLGEKLKQLSYTASTQRLGHTFKALQRVANIGVLEFDFDKNKCQWSSGVYLVFGYRPYQFDPSIDALIEFIHHSDRKRVKNFLENYNTEENPPFIDSRALNSQAQDIHIRIYIEDTKLSDSSLTHLSCVIQDITEYKTLETTKDDFISTVSHELRTPLTSIKGSIGLLNELFSKDQQDNSTEHLFEIAKNNVERLLNLVNDILDIEKASSGKIDLKLKNVETNMLAANAIQQMLHYAEQNQTTLEFRQCQKKLYVSGDINRLTQVLCNLISNAIKFSPEKSSVVVQVEQDSLKSRISVIDQGAGIPNHFKQKVFDKFTQADSSNRRRFGGSGLGLNISKTLIEKHGGSIGHYKNERGETVFFIELNLVEAPIMRATTSDPHKHKSQTLLIVEDDQSTSRHLKILAQRIGFDVDTAFSVEQAIQLLEKNTYSAITVDIMLPDVDGISFVRQIKEDFKYQNTPVIVISAVADIIKKEPKNMHLNVHAWITKPVDYRKFIGVFDSINLVQNAPAITASGKL